MYTFNTLWIRYGYVHSNTDVDFSDAIRLEVGRSWTLTIFELFFVYVGIRSGHTPWCGRAFTQTNHDCLMDSMAEKVCKSRTVHTRLKMRLADGAG